MSSYCTYEADDGCHGQRLRDGLNVRMRISAPHSNSCSAPQIHRLHDTAEIEIFIPF